MRAKQVCKHDRPAYQQRVGDAEHRAHKTREILVLKAMRRHGTDSEGCLKAIWAVSTRKVRQTNVLCFSLAFY